MCYYFIVNTFTYYSQSKCHYLFISQAHPRSWPDKISDYTRPSVAIGNYHPSVLFCLFFARQLCCPLLTLLENKHTHRDTHIVSGNVGQPR